MVREGLGRVGLLQRGALRGHLLKKNRHLPRHRGAYRGAWRRTDGHSAGEGWAASWSNADRGGLGGGHARCTESTEPRLRPRWGSHALGPVPPSKPGRSSSRSEHFCRPRPATTVPGADAFVDK
eukprot:scaffold56774_cov67-Phaeocystis_antarctica.AAC.1